MAPDYRLVWFLFILVLLARSGLSQSVGEFPQPVTISLNKPITASSTCGVASAREYCQYAVSLEDSIEPNCMSSICNDTCTFSSTSPTPQDLSLLGTYGSGVTLVSGRSNDDSSSALKFVNSYISIPSSNLSQFGSNGFTFASWIKQDAGNTGTLISKSISDGTDRTYAVSITESSLTFDYHPSTLISGYSTLTVTNSVDLSSSYWHHIAVTVYQNDFALYINGTAVNATGLISSIPDSTRMVYLGQIAPSIQNYNGLMQDAFLYSQALTEREVQELFTANFPYLHLSTDCHCPPSHPVVNSLSLDRCIQHTGVTTGRGSVVRINTNSHPAGYANDNIYVTSWISAIDQRETNVTLSLVQGSESAYEIIFVFITYGAPAPKAAILQKSIDGGESFIPMQYMADDCPYYFGLSNDDPLTSSDDVNCITTNSRRTPITDFTARVRFLNPEVRPGDINNDAKLQDFVTADHLQISLLDYFTDNTTASHRYYDIVEITVAARCACNGHASRCPNDLQSICECSHNTQGDRCNECLPLYNNKPWRRGTSTAANPCQICNCNNHAESCYYNTTLDPFPDNFGSGGGGVCINCQDNTEGRYCESCSNGYYRPAAVLPSDSSPCSSCGCHPTGSTGSVCVKSEGIPGEVVGQCPCRDNVRGRACDECNDGYFNLTAGCQQCNCNTNGTIGGSTSCNENTGKCSCKLNVEGLKCDQCVNGTQGLSSSDPNGCSPCTCNSTGSVPGSACDPGTGRCTCRPGVTGNGCDVCLDQHHSFSASGCQPCLCSSIGAVNNSCSSNGVCTCLPGFTGDLCDACSVGYYRNGSSNCLPCDCDSAGTVSGGLSQCNQTTGQCSCKENVQGRACDACIPGYTDLQGSNDLGCSPCDCVLGNTESLTDGICDPVTSQCSCLTYATGLRCEVCQDGFYPNASSSGSCTLCGCNEEGSLNSTCSDDGQCYCNQASGRTCSVCGVGQYGFPNCQNCQCNSSGSLDSVCNVTTGECHCKSFVTGMNCDTCLTGYQLLQSGNPFGCSKAPEGQSPPSLQSRTAFSIELSWSPPDQPNGVINQYRLYRNDSLFATVPQSTTLYNDTGLSPYTTYNYQVEAVNVIDSVRSTGFLAQTLQAAPQEVNPPSFVVINASSVRAQWQAPNVSNGIITEYRLILVSVDGEFLASPVNQFTGLDFNAIISGLGPYSLNSFILEACTMADCSTSDTVTVRTGEAPPGFQSPPNITTINSTSLSLVWSSPSQPNGIIVRYEVRQRASPFTGDGVLVETITPSAPLSLIIGGLEAFTVYQYSVVSYTSAGGTQSDWSMGRTSEKEPEGILDPVATVLSASEVEISWEPPVTPNGNITQYQVFIRFSNGTTAGIINDTQPGSYNVSGLSPFTQYQFYVLVCNSAGCTGSNLIASTTLASVPQGLSLPVIEVGESITISWSSPSIPNGAVTAYNVTRRTPSLLPSPLNRDLGTSFYGTGYATFSSDFNGLSGFSTIFTVRFKTHQSDGLITYSINAAKSDIMAIELRNGIPWFVFDVGTGPAVITISENVTFNDGQWHKLVARRNGKSGSLTLDDTYTGYGSSIGGDTFLGQPEVFHIGGLPDAASLMSTNAQPDSNATLNGRSFLGCLHGVKIATLNSEDALDFDSRIGGSGVGLSGSGCPINVEFGSVSFIGSGYLSMPGLASPGSASFTLSLSFRTRSTSGLLLYAYGVDSHIVICLKNSNIELRLKGTGMSEIVASSSSLSLPRELCDGQWHSIILSKESDGIIMEIDDTLVSQAFPSLSLDLTSDLFVGGVPIPSDVYSIYTSRVTTDPLYPFSGCLRDIEFNANSIDLSGYTSQKDVRFLGCEYSTGSTMPSCGEDSVIFSRSAMSSAFNDSTVSSFTEYIYQVSVGNSAGNAFSGWVAVISEGSAPRGVPSPVVRETESSSSSLSTTWERPSEPNGLITRYEVTASPVLQSLERRKRNTPSVVTTNIDITVPDQPLQADITGLSPATNYSLAVTAHTNYGSHTGPVSYALTLDDVPVGVQVPTVTARNSTSLRFSIASPTQPNGVIVSYRLFVGDSVILTATDTDSSLSAQDLSPFTNYTFHLEACTEIGCTNSSSDTAMTLSAPPTGLGSPSLTALSPTSVEATWVPPLYPNGIVLYYTLVQLAVGGVETVVFNGTTLRATVSGLSPNTVYSYRVAATNIAGSVNSNASSVLTLEDVPDQILPPNVSIVSPHSLNVSWREPLRPNGNILNYTILLNAGAVFVGLQLEHTLTGLEPYTQYGISIQACTVKGCSESSRIYQTTPEAVPVGYNPPLVTMIASDSITLVMMEVDSPNGVVYYGLNVTGEFRVVSLGRQSSYETRLIANGTQVGDNVVVSDLFPFTKYQLLVIIVNTAGALTGEVFNVTTESAVPESQGPPSLSLISSTTIRVSWSPPLYPNGIITNYTLMLSPLAGGSSISYTYPSNTLSADISGLLPFSNYSATLQSSNIAGTSNSSDASTIITGEIAPAEFDLPAILSKTPYSLYVSWDPPASPNGRILNYTVLLNGSTVVETLLTASEGFLMYNVTELSPYTEYSVSVEACNSAGCITSPSFTDTTSEAAPEDVPSPTLTATTTGFVIIRWSEPGQPNGVIRHYTLYKALLNSPFSLLTTVDSNASFYYEDHSVSPYTVYQYYIEASNDAGSTPGAPSTVTTAQAVPEGVPAPDLEPLSSSSIFLTIYPPNVPNGVIVQYTITREWGDSLVHTITLSVSQQVSINFTDTSLAPYTNYSYTIMACNMIDCAAGPPSAALTLQAPPTEVLPPSVSLVGDGYSIAVAWQPPAQPNGVVANYTVIRSGIGFYVTGGSGRSNCCMDYVSSGTMDANCTTVERVSHPRTNITDSSGLYSYSYYQYCIIATTGGGSTASNYSSPLRTVAASRPLSGPTPSAVALNATSVHVSWSPLGVELLLGPFDTYSLYYYSDGGQEGAESVFDIESESYTITGLVASTLYFITVNASNGQGTSPGPTINVTTLDGRPAGIIPPRLIPFNATSFIIYFDEPEMPNGAIVSYSILLNSVVVHNQSYPGSVVIGGLKPYTVYTAQLEVCTSFGCNDSSLSSNRTLEGAPAGFASPIVTVLSPYSAFVSWSPPSQLNGIITEYEVHQRVTVPCPNNIGTCYNSSLLATVDALSLNYTVTGLSPATQYGFSVTAVNGGGSTPSGFTTETTDEAPPTFVSPPTVTSLSSSELLVAWMEPVESNGIVTSYTVFSDGTIVFGPTLSLSYTLSSLDPFSLHSFLIQACTSAGCTNSSESTGRTLEAPPTGFDDPIITGMTSDSLTLSWSPPSDLNAAVVYYEVYYSNDTLITNTSISTHNISGLLPFTNYSIYIGACNVAGCTLSGVVAAVTDESLPVGVSILSINALSFERIEISWSPPTQSNGIILYYTLRRDSSVVFSGLALSYTDSNLEGGVSYSYTLEAFNSAGGTPSQSLTVTTPTSSPTGIQAPNTTVLSGSSIRVQWSEPAKANGDIASYLVYVNGSIAFNGSSFSHTVTGLSPFTTYAVRIEVCTIQGDCGSSSSVISTTQQDIPVGVGAPTVRSLSDSSVQVSWSAPSSPNGIIRFYRIMRRLVANQLVVIFAYAGGPNAFSFTDQSLTPFTCYEYQLVVVNDAGSSSGPWAEVTTFEATPANVSTPTFPSVFPYNVSVVWDPPLFPNGIITQYQVFYRQLIGSYVLAVTLPGNVTETVIGGLQPYTPYDFKIRARNSVGSQDSDAAVVITSEASPDSLQLISLVTRTSESLSLTWLPPLSPNGIIRQYALYLNGTEEYRGSASYHTITRLKPFTGYSIQLEACTSAGCTRGVIQGFTTAESAPIGQPAPSFTSLTSRSVRLSWDEPVQTNGIIRSYEVFRMQVSELQQVNGTGNALLVHGTSDVASRMFTDTSLSPHTGYQYAVRANNSAGYSISSFVYIQTLEDIPEGVAYPSVIVISISEISVSWDEPDYPNGVILTYNVYRADPLLSVTRAYSGLNRFFTDTGLSPYTLYNYTVEACTVIGCSNSSSAANVTDESIPEGFTSLSLIAQSNSVITASWGAPTRPNGVITTYIASITSPVNITIPTSSLSQQFTNLQPFTNYTVLVQACTVIGCTSVGPSIVQTLESIPFLIASPIPTPVSPTSVLVTWSPPAVPNGVIIRYILRRNGSVAFDGNSLSFTDSPLLPNQRYSYDIQAFTSVGAGDRSSASLITTPSDTPTGVTPPTLSAVSSTGILTSWSPPLTPNGVIQRYVLFIMEEGGGGETVAYNGTGSSYLVSGLSIFTMYMFRIEACTTTCGTSVYSNVTTLEAPPTGQGTPTLLAYDNETVLVAWEPPTSPNGIITLYSIQRRQVLGVNFYGTVISVATHLSPLTRQFLDEAEVLEPALTFEYRVGVANSIGSFTSEYSEVTLPDAPPEGASDPLLVNKTFNSISLSIAPPTKPNGLITRYILHSISFTSITLIPSTQSEVVYFTVPDLSPYTMYSMYIDTCTSAGCTPSGSISVRTEEDTPTGLSSPVPTVTSSTGIRLDWASPVHPNGEILNYSLWFKLPCPQPQVYPVARTCSEIGYQFLVSTSQLSYQFSGPPHPLPLTTYQFILEAANSVGRVNSTDSITITTLEDLPEAINSVSFTTYSNNQSVALDWSNTFRLNSVLSHFIVIRDGFFLLQGTQTYAVFGNQPIGRLLEFSVKAVTSRGEVTSQTLPLLIPGPNTVSTGTATVPASTTPTTVGTGPTATDTPVYERLPFIIGMIVLALLICFVCFIVLLCFIRPKSGGVTEKYEVMSRQTSPVRDDGTVRASWGPVMEPKISPVHNYDGTLKGSSPEHYQTHTSRSSTRMKSYSPSKVALLDRSFDEGDIPLQDTHIARLSYVEISPETVLGPPPPGPEHDVPQEVPQEVPREVPQDPLEEVVQSPSTHDTSRDTSVISYSPSPPPPPLSLPPEDDAFMDTQI